MLFQPSNASIAVGSAYSPRLREKTMTDVLPEQALSAPATSALPQEISTPRLPPLGVATPAALPEGFVRMGLAPELVQAVHDLGYTQPTPVQEKGHSCGHGRWTKKQDRYIDLMVSSQTGSGKTAAFLLPVLHTLIAAQDAAKKPKRKAEYERLRAEAAANGRSPAQAQQPQRPHQPAQLQGRRPRRSDSVPHARIGAAGGARCD